jgi:hypothetical protein
MSFTVFPKPRAKALIRNNLIDEPHQILWEGYPKRTSLPNLLADSKYVAGIISLSSSFTTVLACANTYFSSSIFL